MSLSEVPVGFSAKVKSIPNSLLGSRLISLGFIPGTYVKVIRSAPLGDPRVYLVMDKLITLRNDDATQIEVTLDNDLMALSSAPEGFYTVVELFGSTGFQQKMHRMGIQKGKDLQILEPMTIKTEKGIFKVGFRVANRILLRRI
ncbi:MAG TPA: FeoA family protein [Pseudothermotoga sp.]